MTECLLGENENHKQLEIFMKETKLCVLATLESDFPNFKLFILFSPSPWDVKKIGMKIFRNGKVFIRFASIAIAFYRECMEWVHSTESFVAKKFTMHWKKKVISFPSNYNVATSGGKFRQEPNRTLPDFHFTLLPLSCWLACNDPILHCRSLKLFFSFFLSFYYFTIHRPETCKSEYMVPRIDWKLSFIVCAFLNCWFLLVIEPTMEKS